MRNIILKQTIKEELESKLPVDRCITIDNNNIVYLYDTMFTIDENDIKVVAKPLLKNYLEKNKIIITDKKTTRWYGQKVFKILKM